MDSEKRIVWTRAKSDWESDRQLFGDLRLEVLHLPCIRTSKIISPEIPGVPYDKNLAVIFASVKSVQFALGCPAFVAIMRRTKKFFCVGKKTADTLVKSAESKDFSRLASTIEVKFGPWSDMESMSKSIAGELSSDSIIVSPGPKLRAFDTEEFFENKGFSHFKIDLYETNSGIRNYHEEHLLQKDIQQIQSNLNGVICFSSPSAVLGFTKYLNPNENGLSQQLIAVAIGNTTMEAIKDNFTDCHLAKEQTIESLFEKAKGLF